MAPLIFTAMLPRAGGRFHLISATQQKFRIRIQVGLRPREMDTDCSLCSDWSTGTWAAFSLVETRDSGECDKINWNRGQFDARLDIQSQPTSILWGFGIFETQFQNENWIVGWNSVRLLNSWVPKYTQCPSCDWAMCDQSVMTFNGRCAHVNIKCGHYTRLHMVYGH